MKEFEFEFEESENKRELVEGIDLLFAWKIAKLRTLLKHLWDLGASPHKIPEAVTLYQKVRKKTQKLLHDKLQSL